MKSWYLNCSAFSNFVENLSDIRERTFALSDTFLLKNHLFKENCMFETDFESDP